MSSRYPNRCDGVDEEALQVHQSMLENLSIAMVDKLPSCIIRNFFRHTRNVYLLETTADP